jgi:type I restriction enzyme, S subunit
VSAGVIGDHVTLQRGTTYKSRLLGLPGPVLLGLASIRQNGGFRSDSLKTYGGESPPKLILRPGDLYVSLKDVTQSADLLGAVSRVPQSIHEGRLTQDTVKLIFTSSKISRSYIFWLLRTPQYRDYCRARAIGTTNLSLSREDFLSFPVPEPTSDRLALVSVLESLNAKLELNARMNETLEAMARAIFKSWFVDFDPVRAKAEGRQPYGMDAATAALFPDSFQDSPLGKIPKGWHAGVLGHLVELITDRVEPTPAKNSTRYVALDDMPSKSVDLSLFRPGSEVNSSIIAFKESDILFGSMRPYFHKVGIAQFDGITRTTTFVLRPRQAAKRHFALFHFSSDEVIEYSTSGSVGTTIPYVTWETLTRYQITIPSPPLLTRFESIVAPLTKLIGIHGEESRNLVSIRDTLLPKLISGEIRVKDAEKLVGAKG